MTFQKNVKTKHAAALLLCILALALCLSLLFITVHARHGCRGAHCSICLHISQVAAALRSFIAVGIIMFWGMFGGCTPPAPVLAGDVLCPAGRSLVALRTRMDD